MGEQPPLPRQPRHQKPQKAGPRNPISENAPWKPSPYGIEEVGALQALLRGDAKEHQQKAALDYIIVTLSGYTDEPFRPGANDRETNYALGRAYVGRQIVKLLKINTAIFKSRR